MENFYWSKDKKQVCICGHWNHVEETEEKFILRPVVKNKGINVSQIFNKVTPEDTLEIVHARVIRRVAEALVELSWEVDSEKLGKEKEK